MSAKDLIKLTREIRELTKEAKKQKEKIQARIKASNKTIEILKRG